MVLVALSPKSRDMKIANQGGEIPIEILDPSEIRPGHDELNERVLDEIFGQVRSAGRKPPRSTDHVCAPGKEHAFVVPRHRGRCGMNDRQKALRHAVNEACNAS
jgi:hypothetical protein